MISGADATYSVTYVEEMIQIMKAENVVLATGIAQGESVRDSSSRGSRARSPFLFSLLIFLRYTTLLR